MVGHLKKLKVLREAKINAKKTPNDKEILVKWHKYYDEYVRLSSGIGKIGKLTNILTMFTVLNIIGVGIVLALYSYVNAFQ